MIGNASSFIRMTRGPSRRRVISSLARGTALSLGLATMFAIGAQAQIITSLDRKSAHHYEATDGSVGFVMDQKNSGALVRFDGSREVLVLVEDVSPTGEAEFVRDDDLPVLTVDQFGGVTVTTDEVTGALTTQTGTADEIELAPITMADLEETTREVKLALNRLLGHDIAVEVDASLVKDDGLALAALEHQLYVVEAAVTRLVQRNSLQVRELKSVTLTPSDRLSTQYYDGKLELDLVPSLGYGAGSSSARVASLIGTAN